MAYPQKISESYFLEFAETHQTPWDVVVDRASFSHHRQLLPPGPRTHTPYELSYLGHVTNSRESHQQYSYSYGPTPRSPGPAVDDPPFADREGPYQYTKNVPFPPYSPGQSYHAHWNTGGSDNHYWSHRVPPSPSVTASSSGETSHDIYYSPMLPPDSSPAFQCPSTSFSGPLESHPQLTRNLFLNENVSDDLPWSMTGTVNYPMNSVPSSEPQVRQRTAQACNSCRSRKAKVGSPFDVEKNRS